MAVPDTSVRFIHSSMSGAPVLTGEVGKQIDCIDSCISGFGSVTLDSLVISSNIATATVSTGHGFEMYGDTGPVIEIEGAIPTSLNQVVRIQEVTNSTTFKFSTEGITDRTATGTITAKIAPLPISKIYSDTNKAAYQFNDTVTGKGTYLRVDDTVTRFPVVNLFSTMSDIDNGTGGTPDTYSVKSSVATSEAKEWAIIADDLFMFFVTITTTSYANVMYWGDPLPVSNMDDYHSTILAEPASNYTAGNMRKIGNTDGRYFARSYSQTGGYVNYLNKSYNNTTYMNTGAITYPNPTDGGAYFTQVLMYETANIIRAILPGLQDCLHHYANLSHMQTHEINGRTILTMQSGGFSYSFDITGPWR